MSDKYITNYLPTDKEIYDLGSVRIISRTRDYVIFLLKNNTKVSYYNNGITGSIYFNERMRIFFDNNSFKRARYYINKQMAFTLKEEFLDKISQENSEAADFVMWHIIFPMIGE